MGGNQNTEPFQYYEELTIKAFLAVRLYHEHIINLIEPMLNSSLMCFREGAMSVMNLTLSILIGMIFRD